MKPIETARIDADTGYIANIDAIRAAEYPSLEHTTYLDHAGTTIYPKSLIDAFSRDLTQNLYGNPHSASASSQLSSQRIDDVRLQVLRFFKADPDHFEVVFTANATAAIKLVADGLRDHPGGFDYAYHIDSHTSLVGVRELAANSVCLSGNRHALRWLSSAAENTGSRPRLLAYPGQSNMTGARYSFEWSRIVNNLRAGSRQNCYILFDAAALASTSAIDLSDLATAPAFTAVSFYKIFGFPDLGALLVRKDSGNILFQRKYFGGGTVEGVTVEGDLWHASKDTSLSGSLEDGTLPFHNIIALEHALRTHASIFDSMQNVSKHSRYLAAQLRQQMYSLHHANGAKVCRIYGDGTADQGLEHGPVIAFNLLNRSGGFISNAEVEKLAIVNKVQLRTGGLCNPGGTANHLGLQSDDLQKNYMHGYRCGGENDVVNGKPTGTIRVSLGAMSSRGDVETFMKWLKDFYVDSAVEDQIPAKTASSNLDVGPGGFIIESLTVFPIKSCAALNIDPNMSWEVGPRGLAWDREWCLVHEGTHQALSQKKYPRMALLRPTVDLSRRLLRVTHNIHGSGWQQIHVSLDEAKTHTSSITICDAATSRKTSAVCGEAVDIEHYTSLDVSRFFTDALGVPCTLARFPRSGVVRQPQIRGHTGVSATDAPLVGHSIALSNESPILLVSRSSVNRLNEQIKARGHAGKAVPAEAFRGNIVVSEELRRGQSESPFAEDNWTRLQIRSDVTKSMFRVLGPCQRCQMVCIDQGDASRRQEPFSTLAKTRKQEGKVWFGMHLCLSQSDSCSLKVGDRVSGFSPS